MAEPHKSEPGLYANVANDLSTLFAEWLPKGSDQVGSFLGDAALALGVREADLARELGVSRATLSGWKARGTIPEAHAQWFQRSFSERVLSSRDHPSFDMLHAGIPAVLHLLRRTDFNPFGLRGLDQQRAIDLSYHFFGRLARMALFIQRRLSTAPLALDPEEVTSRALGQVAVAVAPAILPGLGVSQSVSQSEA